MMHQCPSDRVLVLASRVRDVMEAVVAGIDPDVDSKTLKGGCALGSWVLSELLRANGIRAEFVEGGFHSPEDGFDDPQPHCWVSLGRGVVVDVTATQFGGYDRVHVPLPHSRKYLPARSGREAFDRVKSRGWHEGIDGMVAELVVELHRLCRMKDSG